MLAAGGAAWPCLSNMKLLFPLTKPGRDVGGSEIPAADIFAIGDICDGGAEAERAG